MTERERQARRKAYEFARANMPWWDFDGATLEDVMQGTAESLAQGIEDYFGEDAPADIVAELRAC